MYIISCFLYALTELVVLLHVIEKYFYSAFYGSFGVPYRMYPAAD